MEIMKTPAFAFGKICTSISAVLLAGAAPTFAADLSLQKVPSIALQGDSVSFGYVKLSSSAQSQGRALYVSSGADLKAANQITDQQAATAYTFDVNDAAPTAVVDLGKTRSVHKVSAVFGARKGTMAVYVLPTLPDSSAKTSVLDLPTNLKLSADMVAALQPVAMIEDAGAQSNIDAEFPATTGRYVMVRWLPAVKDDAAFTLAEVAAFGGNQDDTTLASKKDARKYNDVGDSKQIVDSKDVADSKDIPSEGPPEEAPPPAEGPPPGLPPPPPFTFIPQIVPASP